MSAIDNLTAAVAAQTAVDQSAVTLITGFVAELKATSQDPAIQALVDQLSAATAPLAAAVTANTPAATSTTATPAAPAPSTSAAPPVPSSGATPPAAA